MAGWVQPRLHDGSTLVKTRLLIVELWLCCRFVPTEPANKFIILELRYVRICPKAKWNPSLSKTAYVGDVLTFEFRGPIRPFALKGLG
jgi:hypothetical protein